MDGIVRTRPGGARPRLDDAPCARDELRGSSPLDAPFGASLRLDAAARQRLDCFVCGMDGIVRTRPGGAGPRLDDAPCARDELRGSSPLDAPFGASLRLDVAARQRLDCFVCGMDGVVRTRAVGFVGSRVSVACGFSIVVAMHAWHDVELGDHIERHFRAVIEIPKGSKVKYELDKATGLLWLDRVLHSAVHYPANYGFLRSEEHTSELQSRLHLVCRLLLEKKKTQLARIQ